MERISGLHVIWKFNYDLLIENPFLEIQSHFVFCLAQQQIWWPAIIFCYCCNTPYSIYKWLTQHRCCMHVIKSIQYTSLHGTVLWYQMV